MKIGKSEFNTTERAIILSLLQPWWRKLKRAREIRHKLGENFVFSKEAFGRKESMDDSNDPDVDPQDAQWTWVQYFWYSILGVIGAAAFILGLVFLIIWSINKSIPLWCTICAAVFLVVPPGPLLAWVFLLIGYFAFGKGKGKVKS